MKLSENFEAVVENLDNQISRFQLASTQIDPRRDLYEELGYPEVITTKMLHELYERDGIATRVVELFPKESWKKLPKVTENQEGEETEFEARWDELEESLGIFRCLQRADILCGIGSFGVVLLGLNDGKSLDQPAAAVGIDGNIQGTEIGLELLYIKTLDQSSVKIDKVVKDKKNSRYGKPETYIVTMESDLGGSSEEQQVHWSRVLHIVDNRHVSENEGVPRLQTVLNYIANIQKVLGGSPEMFWKGAFPGHSLETVDRPGFENVEIDVEATKKQISSYENKLSRFLYLRNMTAKPLSVQVADPRNHFDIQIEAICITLKCPKRVFMGSEVGQLASEQDTVSWNSRVMARNEEFTTPEIIKPFVRRLIDLSILPEPEQIQVIWEDLNSPTDMHLAEVGNKKTEMLAKYIAGSVNQLIPEEIYLSVIAKFTDDEIESIMEKMQETFEMEEEVESATPKQLLGEVVDEESAKARS